MRETLVRFTETIAGPDGRAYVASACGAPGSDEMWHGWLEFTDGTNSLRTTQESEQPNRSDLMYWAQGLTYVYLEGALQRALHPLPERVGDSALSADSHVRPAAVLDPYSVYRQGEDVLRRQLLALSREQLNAVIDQYDLGATVPYAPRGPLGFADAVDRVMARIRAASAANASTRPPGSELR
jgi:hypothetical protein